jgi:hypothetical protein
MVSSKKTLFLLKCPKVCIRQLQQWRTWLQDYDDAVLQLKAE